MKIAVKRFEVEMAIFEFHGYVLPDGWEPFQVEFVAETQSYFIYAKKTR